MTAANCKEIGGQPDVDGFLVGGASLKVCTSYPRARTVNASFHLAKYRLRAKTEVGEHLCMVTRYDHLGDSTVSG